jgi:hypothetical protein
MSISSAATKVIFSMVAGVAGYSSISADVSPFLFLWDGGRARVMVERIGREEREGTGFLWMGQGDRRRLVGMVQLFDQLLFLTEPYRLD